MIKELDTWCTARDLSLVDVLVDILTAVGEELFIAEATSLQIAAFKETCKITIKKSVSYNVDGELRKLFGLENRLREYDVIGRIASGGHGTVQFDLLL